MESVTTVSSSSSTSTPISTPLSLTRTTASKVDYLYEIEYQPETQIQSSSFPILNPYSIFSRQTFSPLRHFKALIQNKPKTVREYVSASKLDQHFIPAGGQEHFLTLYIPPEFIRQWKTLGYTHLHFGAIRLALTLHGRKGIPMVARMALLDTRFLQYQHACIATVETTLNAGTVFVTLFPNFNMTLSDPLLLEALKVQIQIVGAEQDLRADTATLSYQMVYRVQNHAMDISLPGGNDALLLSIDERHAASCIHVPRQLSKEELTKLLPETWITNYEKLHKAANQPLQSAESQMITNPDGTVSVKFDHTHIQKPRASISFPTVHMISIPFLPPSDIDPDDLCPSQDLYKAFYPSGQPIFWQKDPITGHKFFDLSCDCDECLDSDIDVETLPVKRKQKSKKKKDSLQASLYTRFLNGDPTVGPLGEFSGKYDYLVEYSAPSWRQKEPYLVVPPPDERHFDDTPWEISPESSSPPPDIFMFQHTEADFPPLTSFVKGTSRHNPKIANAKTEILPSGLPKPVSEAEEVLNWQTENALAQNQTLHRINQNVTHVASTMSHALTQVDSQASQVKDLIRALQHRLDTLKFDPPPRDFQRHYYQQQAETSFLHNTIANLKATGTLPFSSGFSPPTSPNPFPSSTFPSTAFPTSSFSHHQTTYPQSTFPTQPFSGFPSSYPSEIPPKPQFDLIKWFRQRKQEDLLQKQAEKEAAKLAAREEAARLAKGKDKMDPDTSSPPPQLMVTPSSPQNPISQSLYTLHEQSIPQIAGIQGETSDSSDSDAKNYSDDSLSGSEFATTSDDEPSVPTSPSKPAVFMVPESSQQQPHSDVESDTVETVLPPVSSKSKVSNAGPMFTIDDIPPSKWTARFQDFHAWMTTKHLTEESCYTILAEFVARFTGTLKDWWETMQEPDKIFFLTRQTFPEALALLHHTFLGNLQEHREEQRRTYFQLKCHSYNRHDLHRHFQRMIHLFYQLGADVSLKQAFLSSLPSMLADGAETYIHQRYTTILSASPGQIQQAVFLALDEICRKRKVVRQYFKGNTELEQACRHPEYEIKSKCTGCKSGKKTRHKKQRYHKVKHLLSRSSQQPRKFRYFRKKKFRKFPGKSSSTRCFLCHKPGHFAKDCPQKRKGVHLLAAITHATGYMFKPDDDLESLFSEDDEPNPQTMFALEVLDDSASSALQISSPETISEIPEIQTVSLPHIPVTIYPSKYAKPIPAIAFIDTGAAQSFLNPKILSQEYWVPFETKFRSAAGTTFSTHLVTKHALTIQLFPHCSIKTKLIGSSLPGKDLLIGFDIYSQLKQIRLLPTGIQYKQHFQPFIDTPNIHSLTPTDNESLDQFRTQIAQSCAESHTEFLTKCQHPLWTNPDFFVRLPFKLNEDINPTKASHSGMNPAQTQLAESECHDLAQTGLIVPSHSQWACEAFYVNNRAEQIRGKMRLVINYQPLNHFLQDDKFPLPDRPSMFAKLAKAQWFSKFDLKSGFWQLGLHPDDQHKTGFCIPNHHYHWTVLPFGLKTAPSLFQKAMIKIFQPILSQALVYIDDILLFSDSFAGHLVLLQHFAVLVRKYGVMLSFKKIILAVQEIDFLGMHISPGSCTPGQHISDAVKNFPETDLTKKQVQQILGLINYIRDFIPRVAEKTAPLRLLLKKNPPPWSAEHQKAIMHLKDVISALPSLWTPTTGIRVLQTDASDLFWSAILLEDLNGTRRLCGYASGHFKDSEAHYHSTFKEILAVKNGIKKFNFYLIGHNFQVEMDMSSFPQMLKFKQRQVPHPQLLRWASWFSQYSFNVKHIKGTDNVVADFFSRPYPSVHMISSSSFSGFPQQTSSLPPTFPSFKKPWQLENLLPLLHHHQLQCFQKHGGSILNPLGTHPTYPFSNIFCLHPTDFPDDLLWFFVYLCHLFYIMIEIDTQAFSFSSSCLHPNLQTFLSWFYPDSYWKTHFQTTPPIFATFLLHRTVHGSSCKPMYIDSCKLYQCNSVSITTLSDQYSEAQRILFQENKTIPKEIWPNTLPWTQPSVDPYYADIHLAKVEYLNQFQDSQDPFDAYNPYSDPTQLSQPPATTSSEPLLKKVKIVNWNRVTHKFESQTEGHSADCTCHHCPSSTPSPTSSDYETMEL